jgi:uncharacterized protein (TIGR02145 family)
MRIKIFFLFAALSFSAVIATAQEDFILINGIKWATRNVDFPGTFAVNPEDAGMFYQWNRNIGWRAADPLINSNGETVWSSSTLSGDVITWEATNNICPEGYRVPTDAEIQSLITSGSQWTTLNGVNGCLFGSGGNAAFFPAAGYRYDYDGALNHAGSSGSYWSSSQSDRGACSLYFGSNGAGRYCEYRIYGQSVRCVSE